MRMTHPNDSESIVEVENVSFSYGESEVLKDIALTIHRGDYLALIGGNGSGKTTLVKLVLGLLAPSTGSIRLFGRAVRDFRDWRRIGYVPQKMTHLANFPATVEEVVLMGRYGRQSGLWGASEEDKKQVSEALRHVGMEAHKDRLIGDLSGGEQQRVFIARALAGEPEMILLDEPTVGVEKDVREAFYALLRKLNRDLRLTVVLVTHDIENVAHEAMRVACLDCTVFFHDSVDAYFKEANLTHSHPPVRA